MYKVLNVFLMAVLSVALVSCGGSSSSGGGGASIGALTTGGESGAAGGTGGNGANFEFYLNSSDGNIELAKSGTVDKSFTIDLPTPALGAEILEVTSDMTVVTVAIGATTDPSAGTPYIIENDDTIYISDGDDATGDEAAVTGISVSTNKTLTFELNASGGSAVDFVVANDIENKGTIETVQVDNTQMGSFTEILCDNYYGHYGSKVNTNGVKEGQHGGDFNIRPNSDFLNKGTINIFGADSDTGNGGNSGGIYVIPAGAGTIANSGNWNGYGGESTNGNGGNSYWFDFESGGAGVAMYNSGTLDFRGGNGSVNGGTGCPDTCYMTNYDGDEPLINSGKIYLQGGDSGTGTPGIGGELYIESQGDDLVFAGYVDSSGGNAGADGQNGADGGLIDIRNDGNTTSGDLTVTAQMDTSGGNAHTSDSATGNGGNAGAITIDNTGLDGTENIFIYASAITTTGGDGFAGGGNGGSVNSTHGGAGDIINRLAITTTGGNATGTGSDGGNGGNVDIDADGTGNHYNYGAIDASGGNDFNTADSTTGVGGYVYLDSEGDLENYGNITSNGGSDIDKDNASGAGNNAGTITLNGGYGGLGDLINKGNLSSIGGDGDLDGGNSAFVKLLSGGDITNTGKINSIGGDGESTGGDGNSVDFTSGDVAGVITNSASIYTEGGDSDPDVGGSLGGAGGCMTFSTADSPDSLNVDVNINNLSSAGGDGETTGTDGNISVDGNTVYAGTC